MTSVVTPKPVAVYEYYSENPWRFLYSTELNIRDDWKRGIIAFYGFQHSAPGLVPVYRFVATTPYYRYQYSTSPRVNGSGWTNEGIAFYAAQNSRQQYVPVYQYYAVENGNWRYHYSTNPAVGNGWRREKIAFYSPTFL
ncbi:hypothetical protein [Egbenema bharatensis]|uniref:hypothetical protein n=1 Tax=Egbenema bharatensis TaxID=3463334 RepID=UPI003A8BF767